MNNLNDYEFEKRKGRIKKMMKQVKQQKRLWREDMLMEDVSF